MDVKDNQRRGAGLGETAIGFFGRADKKDMLSDEAKKPLIVNHDQIGVSAVDSPVVANRDRLGDRGQNTSGCILGHGQWQVARRVEEIPILLALNKD